MKNVLVVEDRPFLLNLYANTIEDMGLVPYTAKDGEEAVALLENEQIDCVVTDYDMPVMGGVSLIHEIRQNRHSNIPVLGVSGWANDRTRDIFLHEGADEFLPKPFRPNDLLRAITKMLSARENRLIEDFDKRVFPRYQASGVAVLKKILQLDIRDISLGGIKLCAEPNLTLGLEPVLCTLRLQNGLVAETSMRLIWRTPQPDVDCEFLGFTFDGQVKFEKASRLAGCGKD